MFRQPVSCECIQLTSISSILYFLSWWSQIKTKPEFGHLATSSNSLTQNVKHNLRVWTFVPNSPAKFATADVSPSFTTNKWSIIYNITLQQQHKAYRSKRLHTDDIELRLVSGVHTWMQLCACTRGQNKFRRKNADNTSHRCPKMHHNASRMHVDM